MYVSHQKHDAGEKNETNVSDIAVSSSETVKPQWLVTVLL